MISAKIIAHSISSVNGKEIVTFELEYPRFIHSELMAHRLFSRNAASSRAIPVAAMIEQVRNSPATPVHWGKNQPGMQASEELIGWELESVKREWHTAAASAVYHAKILMEQGVHKQIVNRILEPFQMMKTVLTATEFDNFFWLRKHADAQPEIKALAEAMWKALEDSDPQTIHPGWWHTPYFQEGFWCPFHLDEDCVDEPATLKEALAISSSCCAQVSYRKLDDSLDKAMQVYARLVESEPVHASPFEHQATPIKNLYEGSKDIGELLCQEGVTHVDRQGNLWSGNFMGWIQHRQLIPNNAVWEYNNG